MEKDLVSVDLIIDYLKGMVERKIPIAREEWLSIALKLVVLRVDEAKLFNQMSQEVAKKKLGILKAQDKKNVAAADLEIESTDEYRFMKDQEDKLYTLDEFTRVAKKSADVQY